MKLLLNLCIALSSLVGYSQDPLNLDCNEKVSMSYILQSWDTLLSETNEGYTFILLGDKTNPSFELVMALGYYSEYAGYYYYTNYGGYFYTLSWLKDNAIYYEGGFFYEDYWVILDTSGADENIYLVTFICLN